MTDWNCDVLVVGGGAGGVAAALASVSRGARTVLAEECPWLGGQLSSQAVPPDEHPWIERFGATRRYAQFRETVRRHYRDAYPLSPSARGDPALNPGRGRVSALCYEPRVGALAVEAMLSPRLGSGRLGLLRGVRPVGARTAGNRLERVDFVGLGGAWSVSSRIVVDATETGELLPMAGLPFVVGAESYADTGELHAPPRADPLDVQALTWCMALSYDPEGEHLIPEPEAYRRWKDYRPRLEPPLPYDDPAYSFMYALPDGRGGFSPRSASLFGEREEDPSVWNYRRVLWSGHFDEREAAEEIAILNHNQNDYFEGDILGVGEALREARLAEARQLTLGFLYWLQTEAPRPDGGRGYPGLRPRGDATGRSDGLALAPYIRESRRILARTRIVEGMIGLEQRGGAAAERFPDSVGVGFYNIDLHPSCSGRNGVNIRTAPFGIPLGALLPAAGGNLIAGAKNIGTTHITNGCYRLHPVEWNIGESAGLLAAFCAAEGREPGAVADNPGLFRRFGRILEEEGIPTEWPEELVAAALDSARGFIHE